MKRIGSCCESLTGMIDSSNAENGSCSLPIADQYFYQKTGREWLILYWTILKNLSGFPAGIW